MKKRDCDFWVRIKTRENVHISPLSFGSTQIQTPFSVDALKVKEVDNQMIRESVTKALMNGSRNYNIIKFIPYNNSDFSTLKL